jgi:cobalt-zinc-cadmium resistance protein CzcA
MIGERSQQKRLWKVLLGGALIVVVILGLPLLVIVLKNTVFRVPIVLEVHASFRGKSPKDVERNVTMPLEVTVALLPGLRNIRSRSTSKASELQLEFDPHIDVKRARAEILQRLEMVFLPDNVELRVASDQAGMDTTIRYTLTSPVDPKGHPIYTVADLQCLQQWILAKSLRKISGVKGVSSVGSAGRTNIVFPDHDLSKGLEIRMDAERLEAWGITLAQFDAVMANEFAQTNSDNDAAGSRISVIKPAKLTTIEGTFQQATSMNAPAEAAAFLRAQEAHQAEVVQRLVVVAANAPATPPIQMDAELDLEEIEPPLSASTDTASQLRTKT